MSVEFFDPGGLVVPCASLQIARARGLAEYLERKINPFASLVECRTQSGKEIVVFDVRAELPQITKADIHPSERMGVRFSPDDITMPEVLALRMNFPPVIHLNLSDIGAPKSPCLYEMSFDELKLSWTPTKYVERMREWLAYSATGNLHQKDQRLEPVFFFGSEFLILPQDPATLTDGKIDVLKSKTHLGKTFYLATSKSAQKKAHGLPFASIVLECTSQVHGVIRHRPANLHQLHQTMQDVGYDLLGNLRPKIQALFDDQALKKLGLVLIVKFPKTRDEGERNEDADLHAFLSTKSVLDIGVEIGIATKTGDSYGYNITPIPNKLGQEVILSMLNPIQEFNRDAAARYNGRPLEKPVEIVAIGAGALGSQVAMNLARAGIGLWSIIDSDILMPHNLARHAFTAQNVGEPKAEILAGAINQLFNDPNAAKSFSVNLLLQGSVETEIKTKCKNAALMLDTSASLPVLRKISSDTAYSTRKASLFLTPIGRDLIFIAEDKDRLHTLDSLEMQYYRAVINRDELKDHLAEEQKRLRYSQGCSDVSAVIPQHFVALHSAIGSHAVQQTLKDGAACIKVWVIDPGTMSVKMLNITPAKTRIFQAEGWTVVTDDDVLNRMFALRKDKLPNETGGVLLGSFDMEHKKIYIADLIPSPKDSKEKPGHYIRGFDGLADSIETVKKRTSQMIEYVGEWHSHPDGCDVKPSGRDKKLFSWLLDFRKVDGLPPVMVIVGERGKLNVIVEKIERETT